MSLHSWRDNAKKIEVMRMECPDQKMLDAKYAVWDAAFADVFGKKPQTKGKDPSGEEAAFALLKKVTQAIANSGLTTSVEMDHITGVCLVKSVADLVRNNNQNQRLETLLAAIAEVAEAAAEALTPAMRRAMDASDEALAQFADETFKQYLKENPKSLSVLKTLAENPSPMHITGISATLNRTVMDREIKNIAAHLRSIYDGVNYKNSPLIESQGYYSFDIHHIATAILEEIPAPSGARRRNTANQANP